VNVCIAIGTKENVSSLKTLSLKSYHHLSRDILGYYRLCAISTATRILHNHRKANKKKNHRATVPYARRLMLTTCYGFKIQNGLLRLPVKPRVNVCIAIGTKENVSSLKTLSLKSYHHLSRDILGYYRLCAISTATRILHNHRKANKKKNHRATVPYARRLMLTTCYGFKI